MYTYDFGLSFAGEDREQAERLAQLLKDEHVRVFYDRDEEANLWGQNLDQKLPNIYVRECRFFIPFVSANYISKRWPQHELKQAQARDLKSDVEYIIPLRLDDTVLPGINDTTAYVDLREKSIEDVAQLCLKKLVRDSAIRQLFIFLRENNPTAMDIIESEPNELLICVATSKVSCLDHILKQISQQVCSGSDRHNTLMNGGFCPPGCIPSIDPEPHTTFVLRLFDGFYAEIKA